MMLGMVSAVSSMMLLALAYIDRWRADWIPSATESWLNLLLTGAWACVAALAVFRSRGNKWLTVLLAIHVPALLADIYIVSARGFSIFPNLPGLLLKQALLFAAVTLPAIAVASVVKSFTHFLLALAAIALALAMLNGGGFQRSPSFFIEHHEIRDTAIRLILVVCAVAAIALKSRAITLAGAAAAFATAAWLPARVEYMAGTSPAPRISLRPTPPDYEETMRRFGPNRHLVLIPITIDHVAAGVQFRPPKIELSGLRAYAIPTVPGSPDFWLALQVDPVTWTPAPLHGTASFDFYRDGKPISNGCTSSQVDGYGLEKLLKVFCEQPGPVPPAVVTLRDPLSARLWRERLNSSQTDSAGPHQVWLSPLSRAQTFFHLTSTDLDSSGSEWLVPASVAPAARFEVTPEVPAGRALTHFDLPPINLHSRRI